MEANTRQSHALLDDILQHAHKYNFHQLLGLLEKFQNSESNVNSRTSQIRISPDQSMGFPASDVRRVIQDRSGEYNVVARFMGMYGVDSPLPQHFLDDTVGDSESSRRMRDFLDILNQRLYILLHQAWKKSKPLEDSGSDSLYYKMASSLAGSYGKESVTTNELSGSFVGNRRSSEALQTLLQEQFLLPELTIESGLVSWISLDSCSCLDGKYELGVNTSLGNAVPVSGRNISIHSGKLSEAKAKELKPETTQGQQFYSVVRSFLPFGIDFTVNVTVEREKNQNWQLGNHYSQLGQNTQIGDGTPVAIFNYNVSQYELHRESAHQVAA